MILSIRRVRQFYSWHKWTGLLTGIFLLTINFSGAVAVFKEDIDRVLTPAKVVRPKASKVSIDTVLDNVRRSQPAARIGLVLLPDRPDAAYVINLASERGERIEVFADPFTGAITGTRRGENFANVLRQLHLRFYFFGFWGRVVVGIFGLVLLISTISGLLIYWRFMRGVFAQALRFWQIRKGWQLGTSDLHKLVGVGALVFNLIIAFTGAFLGLENLARYAPGVQEALQPRPRAIRKAKPVKPAGSSRPRSSPLPSLERSLQAAETVLPGFHANTVTFPGGGSMLIQGKLAGSFARDRASFVLVDSAGEVAETFHQDRGTSTSRLYNFVEPLHYGSFGGSSGAVAILVRSLYLFFGLASAFLSITGFLLWWLKWRKRQTASAGRGSAK